MSAAAPLLAFFPALPEPPTTGGEIYNRALVDGLGRDRELSVATFAGLGVTAATSPRDYAAAALAWLDRERLAPRAVLEDTYVYRQSGPLLSALRARGFGPIVGFGQALYPRRFRSPLVRARAWWALARQLRRYDRHVVVSEAMRRAYRRLGVPGSRVDVVLPGFELAARRPPGARAVHPGLRVVTAGTYMPAKGQHLVVEALLKLGPACAAAGGFSLEALGSKRQAPAYVAALESRAAQLGERIRLFGDVPQERLWEAFARADVFVFPATGEGLGMVVVEAMLCGCVPVVVDDGPLPDLVGRDGRAGRVVSRHPASIAAALVQLAGDPARLAILRAGAITRARSLARDWPETIAAFAAALDRAVGGWGGVPRRGAKESDTAGGKATLSPSHSTTSR